MKILFFVRDGKVELKHQEYQWGRARFGDTIIFSNGSFDRGFEDSCDKIVMACENEKITSWAEKKGYEVVVFEEPLDDKKEEVTETKDIIPSVDEIIVKQLEKAEKEAKGFELPKSVVEGVYLSADGTEYEHKGKAYKKEFKEAILKNGFESFTKK